MTLDDIDFHTFATPDGPKYLCLICTNARPTKDYRRHRQRPAHQLNARRVDTLVSVQCEEEETGAGVASDHHEAMEDNEEQGLEAARVERTWKDIDDSINEMAQGEEGGSGRISADAQYRLMQEVLDRLDSIPHQDHAQAGGIVGLDEMEVEQLADVDAAPGAEGVAGGRVNGPAAGDSNSSGTWFPFRNKMVTSHEACTHP
ncbi:hypothetical protein PGTUg99_004390 [Puccinia graminis f. sp. tritici]|uniref:Uncharacterized protein n=1 Tax=Puccinia graminis f. sp. tritici TaxID=56615 RepID=A0A5B0RIV5_PUCGR|nr:hypothetical protein PGTUg99_004390 [Puccinia graminis f. sp. tritici]